jgi:hypothetical protein
MTAIEKLNALPNPFMGVHLPPKPARKPTAAKPTRKPSRK